MSLAGNASSNASFLDDSQASPVSRAGFLPPGYLIFMGYLRVSSCCSVVRFFGLRSYDSLIASDVPYRFCLSMLDPGIQRTGIQVGHMIDLASID